MDFEQYTPNLYSDLEEGLLTDYWALNAADAPFVNTDSMVTKPAAISQNVVASDAPVVDANTLASTDGKSKLLTIVSTIADGAAKIIAATKGQQPASATPTITTTPPPTPEKDYTKVWVVVTVIVVVVLCVIVFKKKKNN